MSNRSRQLLVLAAIAAVLLPAAEARAQYYSSAYAQPAPLYPYEPQPYAVQVAPNTYVIKRPGARDYPYAGRRTARPEQRRPASDRPRKRNDPALIEELRQRQSAKREVVNTVKVVRDPPVVIQTKRVVDDPPRVVERRHYVEDAPATAPSRRKQAVVIDERPASKRAARDDKTPRVIRAEAEVTIIGPDRMSIRLFRKSSRSGDAKASAD